MNLVLKTNWLTPVKYGLYTAGIIILFQILNHFVVCNILKLDHYLVFVALLFLSLGYVLKKPSVVTKEVIVIEKEIVEVSKEIIKEVYIGKPEQECQLPDLTAREMEILSLIASGKTNKEIAGLNCVELSTIKTHINNLYAKLNVKNRREAIKIHEKINKPVSVS